MGRGPRGHVETPSRTLAIEVDGHFPTKAPATTRPEEGGEVAWPGGKGELRWLVQSTSGCWRAVCPRLAQSPHKPHRAHLQPREKPVLLRTVPCTSTQALHPTGLRLLPPTRHRTQGRRSEGIGNPASRPRAKEERGRMRQFPGQRSLCAVAHD